MMLLMLGFTLSIGAYASNEVKKENAKLIIKQNSKTAYKAQTKLNWPELCVEVTVFIGECPDGTSYFAGSFAVLGTCGCNGEVEIPFAASVIEGDSSLEACG
jgi:predicted nucleic acid binding AN1-type Zn finger protein